MSEVKILLSTFNGERYINELLHSLLKQQNIQISLLVRDDGSKDNTLSILKSFSKETGIRMQLIEGNNIGYLESFWKLIKMASGADYYALCDQDDYWCPEKLSCAVEMIEAVHNQSPILYTSNVIPVNEKLERKDIDAFPTHEVISFADSLKRSVLPGCTFVFNNALLEYLKEYKGKRIMHDWTIYLIAKAVGKVIYDCNPHIMYRLHGNNACGSETGFQGVKKLIKRFKENKTPCARSQVAKDILCFRNYMSLEDVLLSENFANYKNDLKSALYLFKYKEYRTMRFLFMLVLKRV